MSWQERRCNAEGFGRPEPFFFLCEERTYSPPAKQAVVSLPLVGHGALRGGCGFISGLSAAALRRLASETPRCGSVCGSLWTMRASSYRPRSRQGTEQNVPSPPAACANLPPAALPQIWVHRSADAPIFSFAKEKQKLEVKNYGNLPFGSEGYQQRYGPLCCSSRSLYELQRDL